MLYSYQGSRPTHLPERVRLSDGTTRTDSSSYSEEELSSWGYIGPFTEPGYDAATHTLEWDSSDLTYSLTAIEVSPTEPPQTTPDYRGFQGALFASNAFDTVKSAAQSSLVVNAASTEFAIALEAVANRPSPRSAMLDNSMQTLLSLVNFSPEEVEELHGLLTEFEFISHGYVDPLA